MKEDCILLDTNVIVAFLDSKDSLHHQAVKLIEENSDKKFCILGQIIAETYSVIVRRCKERDYNCADAVDKVRMVEQRCILLHTDFNEYHDKIVEALKKNPDLNYNDWLLVLFSRENSFKLLSLDKKVLEELK
jgi:predicted nucleic acid-binding protein